MDDNRLSLIFFYILYKLLHSKEKKALTSKFFMLICQLGIRKVFFWSFTLLWHTHCRVLDHWLKKKKTEHLKFSSRKRINRQTTMITLVSFKYMQEAYVKSNQTLGWTSGSQKMSTNVIFLFTSKVVYFKTLWEKPRKGTIVLWVNF